VNIIKVKPESDIIKSPAQPDKQNLVAKIYRTANIQMINDRSLYITESRIEGFHEFKEGFDITQWLIYFMEINFVKSSQRKIGLKLNIEATFPKDVVGEKEKFEVILGTLLNYFIDKCEEDDEIVVGATMIHAFESGFNLAFEISCSTRNEFINTEYLNSMLINQNLPYSAYTAQCYLIMPMISWLGGTIEVGPRENSNSIIHIEIPFSSYDRSYMATEIPKIAYRYVKLKEHTWKWMWNESKQKQSVARDEPETAILKENSKKESEEQKIAYMKRAEELVKEKLQSKKQMGPPKSPNLRFIFNKINRERNLEMGNLDTNVIFTKILKADGKTPDRSEQKIEDPNLILAAKRKIADLETNIKDEYADTFNVEKGNIKKRSSDKNIKKVINRDEFKKFSKNMPPIPNISQNIILQKPLPTPEETPRANQAPTILEYFQ